VLENEKELKVMEFVKEKDEVE